MQSLALFVAALAMIIAALCLFHMQIAGLPSKKDIIGSATGMVVGLVALTVALTGISL